MSELNSKVDKESVPEDRDEKEMEASRAPLMDHLIELRTCLVRGGLAVIVCAVVCFLLFEPIFKLLTVPLYISLESLELESALKFRTVQGAFLFHFKTSILGGIILGMPVLLYQAWCFVAPGLYRHEKRLVLPFVGITSGFFFAGISFCYYVVMPFAFEFFLGYSFEMGNRRLVPDITLEDYLNTFTKMILAFGIVFQTPIFLGFLSWIGLITHTSLIERWRWATVISFVVAAILTPPDYVTQTLLALPLMLFYGLSILIAWYITRRREKDANSA